MTEWWGQDIDFEQMRHRVQDFVPKRVIVEIYSGTGDGVEDLVDDLLKALAEGRMKQLVVIWCAPDACKDAFGGTWVTQDPEKWSKINVKFPRVTSEKQRGGQLFVCSKTAAGWPLPKGSHGLDKWTFDGPYKKHFLLKHHFAEQ